MKKALLLIFVLLFSFALPFYAVAASSEINFNNDDGAFSVYSNVSIKDSKQEIFGMPTESFEEYMRNNDMLLYATDDKSIVFNVSNTETDFSRAVSDFSKYSDETVLEFADTLTVENDGVVSVNDIKYVVINHDAENDADFSRLRQYVTVKNGEFYVVTLNFIYGADNIDELSSDVIQRIFINTVSGAEYSVVFVIVLLALIILVAIVVVYLAISIIKDLRNK